jgi:hypothetical protein
MVLAWSIIGVVVGITLGLRFKVLVLVPAIALAVILMLIVGLADGDSFWSILLAILILSIFIQLGYLVGIFLLKRFQ